MKDNRIGVNSHKKLSLFYFLLKNNVSTRLENTRNITIFYMLEQNLMPVRVYIIFQHLVDKSF